MIKARCLVLVLIFSMTSTAAASAYKIDKDFLLLQFDSKTDVDDLHTIAAVATILNLEPFSAIHYHAVAGAYGDQDGLYVPSPKLFDAAFPGNWSDNHNHPELALTTVVNLIVAQLDLGADIWVVEAGQSNFTARWLKYVAKQRPHLNLKSRIIVVQHSDWNEEQTSPDDLDFVKNEVTYKKIPDGNAVGNGSPGFKYLEPFDIEAYLFDSNLRKLWQRAIILGDHYNGLDGRYENDAVAAGGLDFSDTVELCWILGLNDLKNVQDFFNYVRAGAVGEP